MRVVNENFDGQPPQIHACKSTRQVQHTPFYQYDLWQVAEDDNYFVDDWEHEREEKRRDVQQSLMVVRAQSVPCPPIPSPQETEAFRANILKQRRLREIEKKRLRSPRTIAEPNAQRRRIDGDGANIVTADQQMCDELELTTPAATAHKHSVATNIRCSERAKQFIEGILGESLSAGSPVAAKQQQDANAIAIQTTSASSSANQKTKRPKNPTLAVVEHTNHSLLASDEDNVNSFYAYFDMALCQISHLVMEDLVSLPLLTEMVEKMIKIFTETSVPNNSSDITILVNQITQLSLFKGQLSPGDVGEQIDTAVEIKKKRCIVMEAVDYMCKRMAIYTPNLMWDDSKGLGAPPLVPIDGYCRRVELATKQQIINEQANPIPKIVPLVVPQHVAPMAVHQKGGLLQTYYPSDKATLALPLSALSNSALYVTTATGDYQTLGVMTDPMTTTVSAVTSNTYGVDQGCSFSVMQTILRPPYAPSILFNLLILAQLILLLRYLLPLYLLYH
jgi:hypothetical protein